MEERCSDLLELERQIASLRRVVRRSSRMRRGRALLLVAGGAVAIPLVGNALPLPYPDAPTAGTAISSTVVWGNFNELASDVESLQADVISLHPRSLRYGASAQVIPNATDTVIDYSQMTFDGSGGTVTTGPEWHFTAPADGIYRVTASAAFANAGWEAGESTSLTVRVAGQARSRLDYHKTEANTGGAHNIFLGGSDLLQLSANDAVDVVIYQNSDAAIALEMGGDGFESHIAIERVE